MANDHSVLVRGRIGISAESEACNMSVRTLIAHFLDMIHQVSRIPKIQRTHPDLSGAITPLVPAWNALPWPAAGASRCRFS